MTRYAMDGATTVNELVQLAPHTLPVLQRYGIDACCGGPLLLKEVAARHDLDLQALLAELAAAPATG